MIFVLIFTVGPYLAFTKHVPFTGYGYQVRATFANGVNISTNSPVRIAGVDVGKVIESSSDGDATEVTFTVGEKGRPIHADAFAQIRPRIFLEGNFFIDLDPGSPSAPEMDSGGTIPVSRTSTSVQLDEVLHRAAVARPRRPQPPPGELRHRAHHEPTAAEDVTQLPEVQGQDRRRRAQRRLPLRRAGRPLQRPGHQRLPRHRTRRPLALRFRGGRTFAAFANNEEDLQGLIVNFDVFTGALAAQSANLATTFQRFAPTLRTARVSLVNLNRTLPPLRAYAIELRPAVAELPGLDRRRQTVAAAGAARCSPAGRLGGIAKLLRESTPGLAGAAQAGKANAIPQINRLSLCTSQVLVPTGDQTIERPLQHRRPQLPRVPLRPGQLRRLEPELRRQRPLPARCSPAAATARPSCRTRARQPDHRQSDWAQHESKRRSAPSRSSAARPPKKPDVRCDTNPVPDLNGPLGQVGPPGPDGERAHERTRRQGEPLAALPRLASPPVRAGAAKTRSRSRPRPCWRS